MSSVIKCLLGVFAILCFVHMIEMTRVRRDDAAAGSSGNADLADSLNQLMNKIKSSIDENTLKNILDTASNAISQGTKAMQEQFSDISSKVSSTINNSQNQQ